MLHGLSNDALYSAFKVVAEFESPDGTKKAGSGTGFFIKNSREDAYFVTNRHVLDLAFANPKYLQFKLISLRLIGRSASPGSTLHDVEQSFELQDVECRFHPDRANDIACIVKPQGVRSSTIPVSSVIPISWLASRSEFANSFSVCDFVAFPGFPRWEDVRGKRPIFRTGTIASDPRFNYSNTSEDMGDCLAYEAFSYDGSSGSPVFSLQKGPRPGSGITFSDFREVRLIGINAGHLKNDEHSHSGMSYLYKSYAILELIDP